MWHQSRLQRLLCDKTSQQATLKHSYQTLEGSSNPHHPNQHGSVYVIQHHWTLGKLTCYFPARATCCCSLYTLELLWCCQFKYVSGDQLVCNFISCQLLFWSSQFQLGIYFVWIWSDQIVASWCVSRAFERPWTYHVAWHRNKNLILNICRNSKPCHISSLYVYVNCIIQSL